VSRSTGPFAAVAGLVCGLLVAILPESARSQPGNEFQVYTYTPDAPSTPAVAVQSDGDFVAAWNSGHDGSSYGVFGRQLVDLAVLDIDGNASVAPLTDGLLVVRFIFGFTGPALTASAIGAGCSRCDAASIASYLAELGLLLDIDGNSPPLGALTDGLLVLRYIFGIRGQTLINAAVGNGCTRCTATQIEGYLQQPAPDTPAGFGARGMIPGMEPARLTWGAVPGAGQYQIRVRVRASGRVIVTQEWLIVPYWQMPFAMPAQQYEYQVRACTTIAATSPCSPWSDWVPFER
jgi:hypothetical protein